MKRLFLSITKGEAIRFLGHLDFLRTLERAIMRSGIPVAFSEGFNPHMRIALDAALGVGVAADPIYLDIRLERDITAEEAKARLAPELLPGITILGVMEAAVEWPKLINFLTEDCYEAEGPALPGFDEKEIAARIEEFNALPSFIYERVTPKKVRKMDVKPLLTEPVAVRIEDGRAHLSFSLVRNTSGTVQPKDLWKLLAESFGMPWTPGEFVCSRCGTYHREAGVRTTPFDAGVFPPPKEDNFK